MSDYWNSYIARIQSHGATPQERAYKSSLREFNNYLYYNQHTVKNLTKDNLSFSGVILSNKQDDNKITQILLVSKDTPIAVGDLIKWGTEYWLIYQETKLQYSAYDKYYIVKCNYEIKWITSEGNLNSSWCYLVSNLDASIKDNFKTTSNFTIEQDNKQINIIMPSKLIEINTRILINKESWKVIDYDKISIQNIYYVSLKEDVINELRDDIENSIANIEKEVVWKIVMASTIKVTANSIISPQYIIYKNDSPIEVTPEITLQGGLSFNDDGNIISSDQGGKIIITYNNATAEQDVEISSELEQVYLIEGSNTIKVGQKSQYTLKPALSGINYSVNNNLATCDDNGYVYANNRNKLGTVILSAILNEEVVAQKQISIISLWQVNKK